MARPQVPGRPRGLPREHQGRAAQRLQGRPARPTSRTRPRSPKSGLYKLGVLQRVRRVRRQALRHHARATTTSAPARRTSPCCRSARPSRPWRTRPFIANAGAAVLRRARTSSSCPTSRTSSPSSRARSTPGGTSFRESEDARYVGLALPRFLLRLPVRREDRPGEGLQLQRGRRRQARRATCGATPPSRWPRRSPTPSPSTAGARTSSARSPAARWRTCRCTSTRRWARSRPRSRPRSCSPSAASTSSREEGFIGLAFRKDSDNAALLLGQLGAEAQVLRQQRPRARRRRPTTASARSCRTCSS